VQSTDDGQGTAAKLTDQQLTQALTAASTRVSVYFGSIMDSSVPQAVPPDVFQPLTLDLAAFYATRIYLKNKEFPATHPVYLAYKDAMTLLNDVRDGKIRLDPAAAGGINSETGTVINRIPPIFNGNDSNTRIDQFTGYLTSDTPYGMWTPRGDDSLSGGAIYQG
jgi:phage gp36-like protein